IHEYDVHSGPIADAGQRLRAVSRLADDRQARLALDHSAQTVPYDGVIVHNQYPNHAALRSSMATVTSPAVTSPAVTAPAMISPAVTSPAAAASAGATLAVMAG